MAQHRLRNRATVLGLLAIAAVGVFGITTAGAKTATDDNASSAAGPAALVITDARIGTRPLSSGTRANPIPIDPHVRETLAMTVKNIGASTGQVRYLRLTGALMGINFVHYEASVNTDVAPGETSTISVPGDFFDIDGVATRLRERADATRRPATFPVGDATLRRRRAGQGRLVGRLHVPERARVRGHLDRRHHHRALPAAPAPQPVRPGHPVRPRDREHRCDHRDRRGDVPRRPVRRQHVGTGGADRGSHRFRARLPVARKGSPHLRRDIADDKVIDLVAADAVARASGQFDANATTGTVPATHESGSMPATHESGSMPATHESGDYSEVAANLEENSPPQHHSGSHEPLE